MNKLLSIPVSRFFSLPFEAGTRKLSFNTLNRCSDFRLPNSHRLIIQLRKLSFHNELLTVGTCREKGRFLKVEHNNLLVTCSVDTDISYLSRYSYFAIHRMMGVYNHYDFEHLYWPNFFTSKNGGSMYLTIINDRNGLDVIFKSKYSYFYKPGQKLIQLTIEPPIERPILVFKNKSFLDLQNNNGIGFGLADDFSKLNYQNHDPFPIPYHVKTTLDKQKVKSFLKFIGDNNSGSDFSPIQEDLLFISIFVYTSFNGMLMTK